MFYNKPGKTMSITFQTSPIFLAVETNRQATHLYAVSGLSDDTDSRVVSATCVDAGENDVAVAAGEAADAEEDDNGPISVTSTT